VRITVEQDRETIKRYGHIRPAPVWGGGRCGARCPGTSRACTLERSHRGLHVAHGMFAEVVAVWDTDTEARRWGQDPPSRFRPFRSRMDGASASLGDVALLIMLLGFLAFAVDWFLRIFP